MDINPQASLSLARRFSVSHISSIIKHLVRPVHEVRIRGRKRLALDCCSSSSRVMAEILHFLASWNSSSPITSHLPKRKFDIYYPRIEIHFSHPSGRNTFSRVSIPCAISQAGSREAQPSPFLLLKPYLPHTLLLNHSGNVTTVIRHPSPEPHLPPLQSSAPARHPFPVGLTDFHWHMPASARASLHSPGDLPSLSRRDVTTRRAQSPLLDKCVHRAMISPVLHSLGSYHNDESASMCRSKLG